MDQSRTTSNLVPTASSSSSREIRVRKNLIKTRSSSSSSSSTIRNSSWKSEKTRQLYSSKLLTALQNVQTTPPSPVAPRRSRAVREAANKALAMTAKSRTRWSRAILTNKIKIKYMNQRHKRQKVNVTGDRRLPMLKRKEVRGIERKVKTLGRLVPGCGKETLSVILEEAVDYIPALEMQVRAMRELFSRLCLVSTSNGVGDSGGHGLGSGL